MGTYTASLGKVAGRRGWSIQFRHPVRPDPVTGKPGLRIHRGLDTRNREEAEQLVAEMNDLLASPEFWSVGARALAEQRFKRRVVEIFYDKIVPEEIDSTALRQGHIPLPSSKDSDYRTALMLGSTGAGKTTLVRQLAGTHPRERFPSTSISKTTVADTEIILAEGPYRAIVTFFERDEIRETIDECISAAALAAQRGATDAEILRKLLNHVDERFRFHYLLGQGFAQTDKVVDDDDDEVAEASDLDPVEFGDIDLEQTNRVLSDAVAAIRATLPRLEAATREALGATDADRSVFEELFEESLDRIVREDDVFGEIGDRLMDEIEARFDLLPPENLRRTRQGWPLFWTLEEKDKGPFIRAVLRFTSIYVPLWGRLLTPLVNGIRVTGPFAPQWAVAGQPKLVLIDGEGLGHTPETAAAVSTALRRRFQEVDAIVLTDSAAVPMQAAPVEALKTIAATGNASKLIFCFTKFDMMRNLENLRGRSAKEAHVIASVENALRSIGEELGPFAERVLRRRVDNARFFVGGIDRALDPATAVDRRTIEQMQALLTAIDNTVERPMAVAARPVYDRANVVLAVRAAAEGYHGRWRPLLGISSSPTIAKAPWQTVKALTRRFALGQSDSYKDLRPVAELASNLDKRMVGVIQNPVEWTAPEPSEDEQRQVFERFAKEIASRLTELAVRRVRLEQLAEWQRAFNEQGLGSSFRRRDIIGVSLLPKAAPVPDALPSPDRNQFLREVLVCVEEAARSADVVLR